MSNIHVITTVWDSVISNDCMQPYRVVQAPPTGGATTATTMTVGITPSGDFESTASIVTVDKPTGNIAGANGGSGKGPGWVVDFASYPITTATGGDPYAWVPNTPRGTNTGNVELPGQPYVFIGTHYGNYTFQIVFGVKSGQTANTVNVPIRIVCTNTGATYDTWIPGSASAFWDTGAQQANFVDVYTGYKGGDPLGVVPINNSRTPYELKIFVRNDVAATIPASNDGYNGTTGGSAAQSSSDTFVQAG
jgi:hypothetical protein